MTIPCTQCGARFTGASATSRCPNCRGLARETPRMYARSSLAPPRQAGRDEGSGLIDLRTMRAGPGGAVAVPGLGGLAPALPVAPTRPITRSHAQLPASQLPLYSLVVALMLGLATLSAHVLTRAPAPAAEVVRVVVPAPEVVTPAAVVEPEVVTPEEPVVAAAVPEVEVASPAPTGRRVRGEKPGNKPVVSTPAPKPAPVVTPVATPAPPDDSVDCLLGRKDCGRPRSEPVATPEPVAAAGDGLPAMLEQADISALTGAGRTAASDACGGLVRGGERVKLRVSIAGPSGSITSTAVVDDAGNPQLAACAAQEVARLPVKKVQKAQIGAMLTLKF